MVAVQISDVHYQPVGVEIHYARESELRNHGSVRESDITLPRNALSADLPVAGQKSACGTSLPRTRIAPASELSGGPRELESAC